MSKNATGKTAIVEMDAPIAGLKFCQDDESVSEETVSDNTEEITESSYESMHLKRRSYKDPLRNFHPSTAVIHAGYHSHLSERAIKPPIFKSSTFVFSSAEEGELFFKRAYGLEGNDGEAPGLVYSRLNNPNTEILEDKMVSLERGSNYCNAFPSGMSAISTTIMALVPSQGHILYTNPVYGGTYFFLKEVCPDRLGVTSAGVDTSDPEQLRRAIQDAPRMDILYLESPANPNLNITDIALAASLAKAKNPNCLIMVDNTFMGPVFQSPFLFGADVVLYSATKFIGGHSDLVAGLVLTKSKDLMSKISGYRTILGPTLSPDTAWMLTRSVETVWLRMERQAQKAKKVARALSSHPCLSKVYFPGSYENESSLALRDRKMELWERQCNGTGSMIAIVVRPSTREAAFTVLNGMKLAHLAVSLGSTETLVEHPRSMTHSDMTETDLDACGIEEGMLRISVGLESSKDIANDLLAALDLIRGDSLSL